MLGAVGAVVIGIPVGWSALAAVRFPSDRTPEGAYLRIVLALNKGNVRDAFPYLETEAQHALCTIHAYRRKALEIIRKSFREPERSQWENAYREQGDAKDPPSYGRGSPKKMDGWPVFAKTFPELHPSNESGSEPPSKPRAQHVIHFGRPTMASGA